MVRCKFKVTKISYTEGWKTVLDANGNAVKNERGSDTHEPCRMATIEASPVYANNDPKHENSKFWAATPSGSFVMGCVNESAVEQFELGGEYYFDISPAAKV